MKLKKNDVTLKIIFDFLAELHTPYKVYPSDGNGIPAWIDDMDIAVREMRNKRTNFVPWEKQGWGEEREEQRNFIKNAFKLNAHMIRREGE